MPRRRRPIFAAQPPHSSATQRPLPQTKSHIFPSTIMEINVCDHSSTPFRRNTKIIAPAPKTAVSPPVGTKGSSPSREWRGKRLGPGDRARPRVHQHAPPRADSKKMRPKAGLFSMAGGTHALHRSGAGRTRQRPRRPRSPGPCKSSSMRFPRHRHKRPGRSFPLHAPGAAAPIENLLEGWPPCRPILAAMPPP